MPFVANTPEALVKRNDSKNPNTTCRGVTGSGRPCRRPLPPNTASTVPKSRKNRLQVDDPSDPTRYCWQHQEQAAASTQSSPGPRISNTPILEERTSIDSLAGRLGLLTTSNGPGKPRPRPNNHSGQPKPASTHGSFARPSKKLKEFTFCCFRLPLYYEDPIPPRPHPTPVQVPAMSSVGRPSRPSSNKPSSSYLTPSSSKPHRPSLSSQPPSQTSQVSQTSQYLSLIAPDTSPDTASKLLKELAKPVSTQDEEGYIYIFWLTPESQTSAPSTVNARSLLEPTARSLEPPSAGQPQGGRDRRPSDVLLSFADAANSVGTRSPTTKRSRSGLPPSAWRSRGSGGSNNNNNRSAAAQQQQPTLLVKIGRANNVMRRMNEWKRQCGYDLSLIRFYPYVQSGSGVEPRKMPHSHKVERLIHLELSGLGLRASDRGLGTCEACGREHKEWFEVEATREGVLRVDEAIRRWVDWDEGRATS